MKLSKLVQFAAEEHGENSEAHVYAVMLSDMYGADTGLGVKTSEQKEVLQHIADVGNSRLPKKNYGL